MQPKEFNLEQVFFRSVEKGQKKIEARLGKRSVDVGDTVRFKCGDEFVDVIVDEIGYYDTFEKMLDKHLSDTLPDHTYEEGLGVYNRIFGNKMKDMKDRNEQIVVMAIRFHRA